MVVVAVGFALWRVLRADMQELRREFDRINDRIDRHLEGHPGRLPPALEFLSRFPDEKTARKFCDLLEIDYDKMIGDGSK